ncbi:MAG: MucR family transcriptional regulator [Sphingobium sp.]
MADSAQPDITILTVQLLSAYVTNNLVPSNELAALIQTTRAALVADTPEAAPEVPAHVPAVSIRKSTASRDHIISLIDGRPYKTLKRHLATHGLTPDTYRARYGLPKSYPMVAADYSEQRRAVAQKLGLGQRGTAARMSGANAAAVTSADTAPPQPADEAKPVARKGRAKADGKAQPAVATEVSAPAVAAPAAAVEKPARRAKAAAKSAADQSPKAPKKAKAVTAPAQDSAAPADKAAPKSSRSRLSIRAGKKVAEPS